MSKSSSSSSPTVHILLIDDNKLGLAARKAVLEELGYRVTTTGSPHDGLKRFAEHDFSLVVTDHKMPKMSGVEFIEAVRKQSPHVPIILLSGFADTLGLSEKNTGADIVIQKSANEVAHMVRAVKKLLRQEAARKKPPASSRTRPSRPGRRTG